MKKKISTLSIVLLMAVLTGIFVFPAAPVSAADQERSEQQMQIQTQEQVYGSELMTPEERAEYSARMRAAKTYEEQERIRREHHEQMKERAREQGVTLPDEMPGRGMGPGMGTGGGMGPGSGGMGRGGRNR